MSSGSLPAQTGGSLEASITPGAEWVSTTLTRPGELLLDFSLKDFALQQQSDGTQQILSSGLVGAGNGGDPELPGRLVRLALPMDTDLASVTLVMQSSQVTVVPGITNIVPVPMPQTADGGPTDAASPATMLVDGKNMLVYGRDDYYGPSVATLVSTQQMGRWKIAEIYYSPFQYNPVAGIVQVTQDATLALEYRGGDPLPTALAGDTNWDAQAAELIANVTDASLWYSTDTASASMSGVPRAGSDSSGGLMSGTDASGGPAASGTTADYVIITTSAIQTSSAQLASFVAHQQARGFSVAVETESTWGGGSGNTAADNLRNWLKANYVAMGIKYVLLVGNPDPSSGNVPMKMTWPRSLQSSDQQAPTDYFFADLTSNWDADGDGKYGEWGVSQDFTTKPLAEVVVGRIPVYGTDYASLDSILAKTIGYEDDLNSAWRKSMLLSMGISNYANEGHTANPRTDGASLAGYIKSDLATPGGYSTYTLFEKSGLAPVTSSCDAALTETNMVSRWSTTPYGIVDWWAHGNATGAYSRVWVSDTDHDTIADTSELSDTLFFSSSDTSVLDNSHPSIVVEVSCLQGYPESSSNLGYSLLKRGAIATISASRDTWYSYGDWQPGVGTGFGDNASYAYYITKQLTSTPSGATVGAALQWTRENLGAGWGDSSWMNAVATNLYGDPSLYLFPPAQIHGTVTNDVNGNGARDAGDPGQSGWKVFLDDNNNGQLDSGTNTLASGTVNLAIPDYGMGIATASQTLSGVAGTIADVNVTLKITHTWDADLTVYLVSPAGTQVQLFANVGGGEHNFTNTTFDDAATTPIASGTAPFTGSFRPAQTLSILNGQNPNGTWKLQISDGGPGDVGTLDNWTLSISTAERSTTTDSSGNYSFGDLLGGTYHVRLTPQTGWMSTNPSDGKQNLTLGGGQVMSGVDFLVTADHPPTIVVGSHRLLPNTPNQTFPIYVSGGGPVQGLNFYIQVGDGGVPAGGHDVGPVITNVDIVSGTIFQNNNTAVVDVDGSGANDQLPMFEGRTTTTASGSVNASGLLGTVTIDTTGFFGKHSWTLKMANTADGSTNFAGKSVNITDGTITTDSPSTANPDAITVAEGGTATLLASGSANLLTNDVDGDLPNDTLMVDTTPVVGPNHGTLVLHADGTFRYTHDDSEVFSDSFVYRISDDAGQTATATVSITVTPVNDNPPVITSPYAASLPENTTAVLRVTATDADLPGDTLTYAVAGGPDAAAFTINSSTGVLSFFAPADYESPTDAGTNNVYNLTIQVFDGVHTVTQAVAVTLTDVNDNPPVITTAATQSVAENTTQVAVLSSTDADTVGTNPATFTITGGADQTLFGIVGGNLVFLSARDYETQAHSYTVEVTANDGANTSAKTITIALTDANDNPPVITTAATQSVAENTTQVAVLSSTDADTVGMNPATFTITGGADQTLFGIVGGNLVFLAARDYETQAHSYTVEVTANDGANTTAKTITVTLADVNDNPPVITTAATQSVAENTTQVAVLSSTDADTVGTNPATFTITGGADQPLFGIIGGNLVFLAARDYETQAHSYTVEVTANDGTNTTAKTITIALTDVNDNPPVITTAATQSVAENTTQVAVLSSTDADTVGANPATFTITGGADQTLFGIVGGNLVFLAARDYETQAHSYTVEVTANDGTNTTAKTITVALTDVNDNAPLITSPNTASVAENTTPVLTVAASDADLPGDTLTFAIAGGPDAAKFAVDSVTGVLIFRTPPAYESPADADANNVYDLTVQVFDGVHTVTQALAVTVTPIAHVKGRYLFYNDSSWDGYDAAANARDDAAIASDKTALLPGQTATFANYTSYTGGINGLMIDIKYGGDLAALSPADLQFYVGNDNSPDTWSAAPSPQSISVRPGAGVAGSDRITITWPDYLASSYDTPAPDAIGNTWLQVVVLANSHTGLVAPDVFYFGNAVGESGNSSTDACVTASDEVGARNNARYFLDPALVSDHFDYNRDQKVNATDEILARNHSTSYQSALALITVPAVGIGSGQSSAAIQGQIFGVVWEDANADGIQQASEKGVGGQTVFLDTNLNGIRDPGEIYAATAGDGSYAISGLTPGTYTVCHELPSGWLNTVPAGGASTATVDVNGPGVTIDFGVRADLPQIIVGNHLLLTDTPNQTIQIMVSGGQAVQGLDFNVQIGDGGLMGGEASTGPTIQTVDVLSGTILQTNNTAVRDVDGSGAAERLPMFEGHQTTTASGTVSASGLLATLVIDTTGWHDSQTWTLSLSATANGSTDFAGIPAYIVNGTITLARPPVWNGQSDGTWGATSSWLGGVAPQGTGDDRLLFVGSGTANSVNDLDPDTVFQSLAFQGGDFTLSGRRVVLNPSDGTGISNTDGNTQIALPIKLAADSTVLVSGGQLGLSGAIDTNGQTLAIENTAGHDVRIEGTISGGGSLSKGGDGTVVLAAGDANLDGSTSAPAADMGNVTVNAGTLRIDSGTALAETTSLFIQGGEVVLNTGANQAVKVSGLRLNLPGRSGSAATSATHVAAPTIVTAPAVKPAASAIPSATLLVASATSVLPVTPGETPAAVSESTAVFQAAAATVTVPSEPLPFTAGRIETLAAVAVVLPTAPLGAAPLVPVQSEVAAKSVVAKNCPSVATDGCAVSVAFRSAKAATFAERKATNGNSICAVVSSRQAARPRWLPLQIAAAPPVSLGRVAKSPLPSSLPSQRTKAHDAVLQTAGIGNAATDLAWARAVARSKARHVPHHPAVDSVLAKYW